MEQGQKSRVYEFIDPNQEALFRKLTHSFRCSVCQNQSLADSQAPISVMMRNEVYQLLKSERSEKEIILIFKERYGDVVFFDPPFQPNTMLLWFGPLCLLILGGVFFMKYLKGNKVS